MKFTLRIFLLAFTTALLAGCYAVQKSTRYYGIDTTGQNVVFLLDTSGSMEGKNEGNVGDKVTNQVVQRSSNAVENAVGGFVGHLAGKQISSEATKLGAAKRALIPSIRGLDETSLYAIDVFGGNVDTWHEQMVPATSMHTNTDVFRVNNLSANGGTPMLAALERGFRYQRATTIFLLTDGQPTDSSATDILARARELNAKRNIAIYTIGFGKDKDAAFLRQLARENGGKYVDQTHAGQLLPF